MRIVGIVIIMALVLTACVQEGSPNVYEITLESGEIETVVYYWCYLDGKYVYCGDHVNFSKINADYVERVIGYRVIK